MPQNWLQQETATSTPERVLHDAFGHNDFRPGQRDIIQAVLADRDVYCIAPTAKGKSLCYQLPALMQEKGVSTLVVSPLIALMNDQMGKMNKLGIPVADIHSLNTKRTKILLEIARKEFAMIFSSPEQLQKPEVFEALNKASISRMVVDEAHCVSTWGHDFRPDYGELGDVRKRLSLRNVSSFTATANPQVERDIKSSLGMSEHYEHKEPVERPNLQYSVLNIPSYREKPKEIASLIRKYAPGPHDAVVVYCGKRGDVGRFATTLKLEGIKAGEYHGEMGNAMRKSIEEGFIADNPRVLVATNAFGMGIDKPNIRLIIHASIPGSVQSYVQETGRAGRDGKDSHCALLFCEEDSDLQEFFIEQKSPSARYALGVYKVLDELRDRQSRKPDEQFFVDMFSFYRRFDQKDFRTHTGIVQNDGKVNSAINVMKTAEVMEKNGSAFRLNGFTEDSIKYALVGDMLQKRKIVAEFFWNQMLQYARHKKPTQEMLLKLLNTEIKK